MRKLNIVEGVNIYNLLELRWHHEINVRMAKVEEGDVKERGKARRCSPILLGQDLKFGLARSRGVSEESITIKTTSPVV